MKNDFPWLPPINLWTVPYAKIAPSKDVATKKAKEESELDERLRARAQDVRTRHDLYGARAAGTGFIPQSNQE
jgi:hypothetical protein